jgi:UDP-N-acetylmuramoyl-tripeptide--D-alanyl-D-alanine ligase
LEQHILAAYGSRENILKAKLEILEGLGKKGTVIINYDNDLLYKWYYQEKQHYQIITYGLEEGAQIIGKDLILKENGSSYKVTLEGKDYKVNIPVGGEHFISNSLCALGVAQILQIPIEAAIKGIAEFELTKKRMEIKTAKIGATVINDCYNANYDSMKAALNYLGNIQNKRKIAVLGDMLELGEYSKSLHEQVGEEVAKNKIDILICIGEEAKHIAQKAQEKGMKLENIILCKNNTQAIENIQKQLQKEDVILLKASNGLNFSQICEALC